MRFLKKQFGRLALALGILGLASNIIWLYSIADAAFRNETAPLWWVIWFTSSMLFVIIGIISYYSRQRPATDSHETCCHTH